LRTAKIMILILFSIVGCSCLAQSGLEKFAHCDLGEDFQIVQVDRLPRAPMSRTVETSSGSKEVVMIDGYRVLITYKETEPFVNLKAEQFEKARYATDKQTLISSLENSAKGTPNMASAKPERVKVGSFDAYGINRRALEGGVLSTYILFDDSAAQALTAYILNEEPKDRKFQAIGEYEKIRDNFLKKLGACTPAP
jgi:hypothetical protein